jgi:hypothetical protein
MRKKPKRLAPSRDTLRELYLKSGNRCAFPGCERALFNAQGVFVAQVCHIEAAATGGERFNENQTDEERRAAANLVLMCYDHHVETNDVDMFPVERMKQIKLEHEQIFSDVVGRIQQTITDRTTLAAPKYPKNLRRLNRILAWNLTDSELLASLEELLLVLNQFAKLPLPTRQFFKIVVNHGHRVSFNVDLEVSVAEVEQSTALRPDEIRGFLSVLDRHGFIVDANVDEFGVSQIGIAKLQTGWSLWSDLKSFAEKVDVDLALFCESLDFAQLDEG